MKKIKLLILLVFSTTLFYSCENDQIQINPEIKMNNSQGTSLNNPNNPMEGMVQNVSDFREYFYNSLNYVNWFQYTQEEKITALTNYYISINSSLSNSDFDDYYTSINNFYNQNKNVSYDDYIVATEFSTAQINSLEELMTIGINYYENNGSINQATFYDDIISEITTFENNLYNNLNFTTAEKEPLFYYSASLKFYFDFLYSKTELFEYYSNNNTNLTYQDYCIELLNSTFYREMYDRNNPIAPKNQGSFQSGWKIRLIDWVVGVVGERVVSEIIENPPTKVYDSLPPCFFCPPKW